MEMVQAQKDSGARWCAVRTCVRAVPAILCVMKWDREKCLTLLDEYKKHPELWYLQHGLYYNKVRKHDCWVSIAQIMECSPGEGKKKMGSLLASFRMEEAKKKKDYSKRTRAIVQHHISNTLFNADMGQLVVETRPFSACPTTASNIPTPGVNNEECTCCHCEVHGSTEENGGNKMSTVEHAEYRELPLELPARFVRALSARLKPGHVIANCPKLEAKKEEPVLSFEPLEKFDKTLTVPSVDPKLCIADSSAPGNDENDLGIENLFDSQDDSFDSDIGGRDVSEAKDSVNIHSPKSEADLSSGDDR
ncbi:putative Alcohol dehydrogenase transcription factor Myb/SANT-like-containing protein 21 [Homarus americanus]|uniref:Putative Alcohol dehydrogenase transcription factor Myb/SANT-like-containing protein 21 n=1 Tax=Homarus americanus TaxID=6706 RepID=A0A8J5MWJ3_HOMAM|nr:putative Alcohol dehydrogenase transcription factor Myb/SANT-like-containing protein 21 [Homarus americanus]